MDHKTRYLVLHSLMIALVCITTMTIQIPMHGTNVYVNIGDSVIFITSILFGPMVGMVAGGIGSALADILTGYAHWAIFTLIIKGLEGYVVGIIIKNHSTVIKSLFATALGTITMVIGYFLAGIILKGNIIISAASIPGNLIQGIVCMAIAILLSHSLAKVKHVKTFKAHS